MLKIIIDTNVIISALLKPNSNPALIVSLALSGRVPFYLSNDIWDEYQGVLARDTFKVLGRRKIKKFLAQLKKKAKWVSPQEPARVITVDPEDNKFLEAAQEAQADFVITGNTKHFPFKKFKKSRIVTPAEFLDIVVLALTEGLG